MSKSFVVASMSVCLIMVVGLAACGSSDEGGRSPAADGSTSTTLRAATERVTTQGRWEKLDAVGQLPASRAFCSMAYDPDGQKVVVFGGWNEGTDYNDIWTYDPLSGRWTSLDPEGEVPAPRELAPLVYDPVGKKIYMFGGWDEANESDLGDTWCYDPGTNLWTEMKPVGDSPSGRDGHSMIYDPVGKRIVLFGGSDQDGEEHNDTWSYDPAKNVWTEVDTSSTRPPARAWHCVAYDPADGRMLVYGGAYGEEDSDTYLNDTWALDLTSHEWEDLDPDGDIPSSRFNASMVYDTDSTAVFLYGGGTLDGAMRDMWAYDVASNTWIEMQSELVPDAVIGHAMVGDQDTGRILLFGGISASTREAINEVWAYQPPDVVPAGQSSLAAAPRARTGTCAVYDSMSHKIVLFGGNVFSYDDTVPAVHFHDTWSFDPASNEWRNLRPEGDLPSSRSDHAMAYDPVGKCVIMFGGATDTNGFDDTWSYNPVANRWSQLRPSGETPSPRLGHAMVYDSGTQTMIMFGGYNGFDYLDETWAYDPAVNEWTELHPKGEVPTARQDPIMFHDGETIYMLGGTFSTSSGEDQDAELDEVWAFDPDAQTWTSLDTVGQAPSTRFLPVGAFDEGAGQLVLFGGADSSSLADLDDTWRYDPGKGSWSEYAPEGSVPCGREDQAMVYDEVNSRVFMFGGMQFNDAGDDFGFLDDIWEYDCSANTWTELTPATSSAVQASSDILAGS